MKHDPYKAMYIHIPFCKKRCNYCDFTTYAVSPDDAKISSYVDELCMDIRQSSNLGDLSEIGTIYIGGGTPSYIGIKNLTKLLYMVSIFVDLSHVKEFSIEANPDSISENLIKDIWALGVNRISIGVQSFNDDLLGFLGRIHDSDTAKRAISIACLRFNNVSVDLMCGLPNQTSESFVNDIKYAINLGVKHISIYPLSVEPHTILFNKIYSGEVEAPDDDLAAAHMEAASSFLESNGFIRYEVASYCKPKYHSKHNLLYWSGIPYIGFGKSAVTMTQNLERRMRIQDGRVTDDLDRLQIIAEDLMLGMRKTKGISKHKVEVASKMLPKIDVVFKSLLEDGLIFDSGRRWQPTKKGWLCGNELYGRIFDLAP